MKQLLNITSVQTSTSLYQSEKQIFYLELIKVQCVVPIFINLFEDPLNVFQTHIVRDGLEEADNLLKIQVTTGIEVYLIEQIQKILGQIIIVYLLFIGDDLCARTIGANEPL